MDPSKFIWPPGGLQPKTFDAPVEQSSTAAVIGVTSREAPPPVSYSHDKGMPCACLTCQTEARLNAAAVERMVEAQAAADLADVLATQDAKLDAIENAHKAKLADEARARFLREQAVPNDPPILTLDVPRIAAEVGYEALARVLDDALEQAQHGKGKDRHASGEPFVDQPIVKINLLIGSSDGAIYQVMKKIRESKRLPPDRQRAERLGAINYIVASILVDEILEMRRGK